MTWVPFSHGLRLDPMAKGRPEAVVALLPDAGDSAAALAPVAARWATTVPTTAFIAFEGTEQLDPAGSTMLDRSARRLKPWLEEQLQFYRFSGSRLVLVGFGHGGRLALHLLLRRGWRGAGILAFAATLTGPLPRILRTDTKVRPIEGTGRMSHSDLRDVVTLLSARGIDARGVLLTGPALSDEAIRHGAAYLVELVATAQRRSAVEPETSDAR